MKVFHFYTITFTRITKFKMILSLNFFILLIKFLGIFLLKVIFNNSVSLKVAIIILFVTITYSIYKYKPKKKDAEEVYNIHNLFENFFNLFMVILFILVCIFGIFF